MLLQTGGSERPVKLLRPAVTAASGLLVLSLAVSGCSSGSTKGSDNPQGGADSGDSTSVTVAEVTPLVSWDPYAHSDTPDYSRWANVMEPLIGYSFKEKKYTPVLATSWHREGKVWTFNLRHGVKFQDGTPFTSSDVVFTIHRIKTDPKSLQRDELEDIVAAKAEGKFKVEITTDKPDPVLLARLFNRYISCKETYQKHGAQWAIHHPNGTGPYTFEQWQRGTQLILKKNPDYWGSNDGPDQLIIKTISEPEARVAGLLRGTIDIARQIPLQDLERIRSSNSAKVLAVPGSRILFFPINPAVKPFDDVRVRRAVEYGVNRAAIYNGILKGLITPSTGPFPPALTDVKPDFQPYKYNPTKAKRILQNAGYTLPVSIDLTTPTGRYPRDVQVAQAVAQQLDQAGFKVTVKTPEWGTFVQLMSDGRLGLFQISRGGWTYPDDYLNQYFTTGVTKRSEYSNPKFDALTSKFSVTGSKTKRLQIQAAEGKIAHDDAVAVWFGTYKDLYGVSKRIQWQGRVNEDILGTDISVK